MPLDLRLIQELLALRERLRAAIEGSEISPGGEVWSDTPGLEPAVDVWEGAEEIVVEIELPGTRPEDISLRLENHDLCVTGQISAAVHQEARYLRMERPRGTFARRIPLPTEVAGQPRAILRSGVLRVHLPKGATSQRRTIPVQQEGP